MNQQDQDWRGYVQYANLSATYRPALNPMPPNSTKSLTLPLPSAAPQTGGTHQVAKLANTTLDECRRLAVILCWRQHQAQFAPGVDILSAPAQDGPWDEGPSHGSDAVFDPAATACLAIDCQERFRPCLEGRKLDNIVRVLEFAHRSGIPVFLTQHCDINPGSVLSRFWQNDIVQGSADWHLLHELPVLPTDHLVQDKHTYDAFMGTGLEQQLRDREVDRLIVVGAMTNLCCETTSRSAFTREFNVALIEDANGTVDESMHHASVENLRFLGCSILTTDRLLTAAS